MTHYTNRYDTSNPTLADMNALQDMREYLGEELWSKMGTLYYQPGAKMNATGYTDKKKIVKSIRMNCHILLGVSGRPVRAYTRMLWRAHK